jgi:hypothetical protein
MRSVLRRVSSSALKSDRSSGTTSSGSGVGVGFGSGDSDGEVSVGEADVSEGVEVGVGEVIGARFGFVITPET